MARHELRRRPSGRLDTLPDHLLLSICCSPGCVASRDLARLQRVARGFWAFRGALAADGSEATLADCAAERLVSSRADAWRVQSRPRESWLGILHVLERLPPLPAVASGGAHTVVAQCGSSGGMVAFGSNQSYQLGASEGGGQLQRGSTERFTDIENRDEEVVLAPRVVPGGTRAVAVAAGAMHSMCLEDGGTAYTWGADRYCALGAGGLVRSERGAGGNAAHEMSGCKHAYICMPRRVTLPNPHARVSQVSCGDHHSACVTADGQLLTWGHAGSGRLGLDARVDVNYAAVSEPRRVQSLAGQRVYAVDCGAETTGAIVEGGRLHMCGRLPGKPARLAYLPVWVQFPGGAQVIALSCGRYHFLATAALSSGGGDSTNVVGVELFEWGCSVYPAAASPQRHKGFYSLQPTSRRRQRWQPLADPPPRWPRSPAGQTSARS